jgi:hypothetical protein
MEPVISSISRLKSEVSKKECIQFRANSHKNETRFLSPHLIDQLSSMRTFPEKEIRFDAIDFCDTLVGVLSPVLSMRRCFDRFFRSILDDLLSMFLILEASILVDV